MANILLVDDDQDVLKIAQAVLESAGHRVESTLDAMSAFDVLEHGHFDILISDANMPHFSGLDLVKTIRNDKRFRHLSLMMLTGRREKKDIEMAIRAGIDDYVVKPIEPNLIIKKVERLLSHKPTQTHPHEILLATTTTSATAHIRKRIRIVSVSDEGMLLASPDPAALASQIELDTNFFLNLGMPTPTLKVASCVPEENNPEIWEVRVQFVGLKEAHQKKLRAWITASSAKAKAA